MIYLLCLLVAWGLALWAGVWVAKKFEDGYD